MPIQKHDEPTRRAEAEKDHAIAAEVWNRLGIDDPIVLREWLNTTIDALRARDDDDAWRV